MKFFFEGGANLNKANKLKEYPLQLASKFNKIALIKYLLKLDKVNLNTYENEFNPLIYACSSDETEIACMLAENPNVNVDVMDKEQGWTPLLHAVSNNNEQIVARLLDRKCNLDCVDLNGDSAAHLAVMNESDLVLKQLIRAGASKFIRNKENKTPLDIAKENESEDLIQILI
jgi:ankyrin repeat protein